MEAFHKQGFLFCNYPWEMEEFCPHCANREINTEKKKKKEITFISAEAELMARLGIDRKSEVPKLWDLGAFWCFLHGIYSKQQW